MSRAWQDAAGADALLWLAAFGVFLALTVGLTVWLRRGRRRWRRRRW